MCVPIDFTARDDAERAGGNTVPAAVADIILDVNVGIFIVNNRAGRTCQLAWGLRTMLTDVAHHQPAPALWLLKQRLQYRGIAGIGDRMATWNKCRVAMRGAISIVAPITELFDKSDVA